MKASIHRVAAILSLLILVLPGCGSHSESDPETPASSKPAFYATTEADLSRETPKKPYKLALLAKKQADPYYAEILESAQKQAKALNVNLEVACADTTEAQGEEIKKALAAKPDALLIIPVDSKQVVNALTGEAAQKMTIIHLADEIHPVALKNNHLQLSGFVGNDNITAGKQAVPFYEALNKKGGYLRIRSSIKNTTGSERADGLQAANHRFGGLRPVLDQVVDDPAEVKPLIQKALQQHPDLVAVFTTDDALALAARSALGGKGVPVFGFGGSARALAAVQSGQLSGTINCHPDRIGADAVAMAVGILNGDLKVPSRLIFPAEAIVAPGIGK